MISITEQQQKVISVIKSCTTSEQRENALQWARDWSKRMQSNNPEKISWSSLYLGILESLPEGWLQKNI